jgi:hypothetical protein
MEANGCASNFVFIFNATQDLIILGRPFFQNSNITVDYEKRIIGLNNGKNLNPTPIDYQPRVIMLFVVFSLIAIVMGLLVRTLNKEDLNKTLALEEARQTAIN